MKDLLLSLLKHLLENPAAYVGTVLGLVALVVGTGEIRRRRVALAVYHAFHVVEDIDAEANNPTLDKVKEGLKAADEWMRANGWRPLKPGEVEVAKLGFKSLNAQSNAVAAAVVAVPK